MQKQFRFVAIVILVTLVAFFVWYDFKSNHGIELVKTGRSLDLAIAGRGFFCVENSNGETLYTRSGHFRLNAYRRLVLVESSEQLMLSPNLVVPSILSQVIVRKSGDMLGVSEYENDNSLISFGGIAIALFQCPDLLEAGKNGLLKATDESGTPLLVTPGESNAGFILTGWLEMDKTNRAWHSAILFLILLTGVLILSCPRQPAME